MASHMKTTVQIPDSLFEEVRGLAARDNTTLKAMVEEGLRKVVAERREGKPFKLRRASFKGNGLQPHLDGAGWDRIRELGYDGRGG